MGGVDNRLLSRDRETGKVVTGLKSRYVTAHEVSNTIVKLNVAVTSGIILAVLLCRSAILAQLTTSAR